MRRICIITGTRAEWGILSGLAASLAARKDVQLQILATNMHLSAKFGRTVDEIRSAGFVVDAEVPMIDDAAPATSKETVLAMGREMTGFAEAFDRLEPDLVVILGDRYEMLVAASAALVFGIPIAHLHGGERTEGAFDDMIRHAITKLSALHFTSTDECRNRVIQMGESPERVFSVGALGCENIRRVPLMSRNELEQSIDFALTDRCFLVTYHPVTLGKTSGAEQVRSLMEAMEAFPDYRLLVTHPNSDKGNDEIVGELKRQEASNPERIRLVTSLGMRRYLSSLPLVSVVVGNSSSGLVEVPSFGIPTVNIGSRQDGRTRAESVIDCGDSAAEIRMAISRAVSPEFRAFCRTVSNPYDKKGTAAAITDVLTRVDLDLLTRKRFYDMSGGLHV